MALGVKKPDQTRLPNTNQQRNLKLILQMLLTLNYLLRYATKYAEHWLNITFLNLLDD